MPRSRPATAEVTARVRSLFGDESGGWVPGVDPVAAGTEPAARAGAPDGPMPAVGGAPAGPVPTVAAVPPVGPAALAGPVPAAAPPPPGVWASLRTGRLDPGRRGAVALVVVALAACLVAVVVLLRGRPSEQPLAAPVPPAQAVAGAAGRGPAGPSPSPAPGVVVAVAGHVRRPGLVRLPAGSRVDDAVRAAGGLSPGAGPGLLNLARRLVDGEQVLVGIDPPPGAAAPAAGPGSAPTAAEGGLVDLNAASAAELDALPGIGPVLADHIVAWRTEHGRFASVDQLREVSGIGESKYQALKSKVRV